MVRLLHVHLPNLTPYPLADAIQSHLLLRHALRRAALKSLLSVPPSVPPPAPPPTLLTFSTPPTYTVGRRYLTRNPLPPSQISYLTSLDPATGGRPLASYYPAARGGDLTYHGPGQLTAYPLLDLRSHRLTARHFVHTLERAVIDTAARLGVADATTDPDNPGVWIADTDRKLCAVGVRVSTGLTSHGVGLNVWDPPLPPDSRYYLEDTTTGPGVEGRAKQPADAQQTRAQGYLSWGFQRIVACGLEGKSTTRLTAEGADPELREEAVGVVLAEELAAQLRSSSPGSGFRPWGRSTVYETEVEGVERMGRDEVDRLIGRGMEIMEEWRREGKVEPGE